MHIADFHVFLNTDWGCYGDSSFGFVNCLQTICVAAIIVSCDAERGRVSCSVVMALCLCREVVNHSESGGLCHAAQLQSQPLNLAAITWIKPLIGIFHLTWKLVPNFFHIATGPHFNLSSGVPNYFKTAPDFHFNVMQWISAGGSGAESHICVKLEQICSKTEPNVCYCCSKQFKLWWECPNWSAVSVPTHGLIIKVLMATWLLRILRKKRLSLSLGTLLLERLGCFWVVVLIRFTVKLSHIHWKQTCCVLMQPKIN